MKRIVGISTVLLVIIGAIIIGILAGKASKTFMGDYRFPEAVWNKQNRLIFSFEIPEKYVNKPFSMYVEMTHTPSIRRDAMYMDITAFSPEGDERTAEYQFFFKNAEGKFKGEVQGQLLHVKQLMRSNFVFSQSGTWKFEVEQRSTLYDFAGLEDFKLIFEEFSPKKQQ